MRTVCELVSSGRGGDDINIMRVNEVLLDSGSMAVYLMFKLLNNRKARREERVSIEMNNGERPGILTVNAFPIISLLFCIARAHTHRHTALL